MRAFEIWIVGMIVTASLAVADTDICHIPRGQPENFETITVTDAELDGHLAHGDFDGPCWMDGVVKLPNGQTAYEWSCQPKELYRLCPSKCGRGNNDFSSHGPRVQVDVNLRTTWNTGPGPRVDRLEANVFLNAKETTRDWTEACLHKNYDIGCAAEPGFRIEKFLTDTRSTADYVDRTLSPDKPPVQSGNLVREFEVMGDGPSSDVGGCGTHRVWLTVRFNKVSALLTKWP